VEQRRDAGDGHAVFGQLKTYLSTGAPGEYVTQTVLKLTKLAKKRRFGAYKSLLPASIRNTTSAAKLREEWDDAIPYRLKEQYEGLTSVWNLANAEHQSRMQQLMHQWIIEDKENQWVIEDKFRFFQVEGEEAATDPPHHREQDSYLAAVRPNQTPSASREQAEHERLKAICLQEYTPLTKLRKRTKDETAAILLILNHDIEVPKVPSFLVQSMNPAEMAVFEDLFLGLDYPYTRTWLRGSVSTRI
jgi:hypothetical protein